MNLLRNSSSLLVRSILLVCRTKELHYLPTMSKGKLSTPHFSALLTPSLLELERVFKSAGYEIRLVGGVVRDLLMGKSPKDVDIGTACRPEDMMELLKRARIRYIPTGLQHGTITVIRDNISYEVSVVGSRFIGQRSTIWVGVVFHVQAPPY